MSAPEPKGVGVTTTAVTEDEAGMRVDRWFRRRYPTLALSHLAKICRKGEVRVDGKRVDTSTRLEEGQKVRVPPLKIEAPASPAVKRASPEDVDTMMKLGANHPMGPLSLADLIGLDIVLDIMQTLYNGFDDPKYRPSPLLKQMCDAGYLGRKSGRGFFTYEAHA